MFHKATSDLVRSAGQVALSLEPLLSTPLEAGTKGLPCAASGIMLAEVPERNWNLLQGCIPLPSAVLKQRALEHNAGWMQNFQARAGLLLAPHGKTTMAPQLFDLQLRHGAWGITVATVQQLQVCRRFGVQRVLMANQLLSSNDIAYVAAELRRDQAFEFYCLVDSVAGAERLQRHLEQAGAAPPLRTLVEVGIAGGRTGCRTAHAAIRVARRIATLSRLSLHGVECYEGIIATGDPAQDEQAITALLERALDVYHACKTQQLFADQHCVLLSAGGSAWFDVVAATFGRVRDETVRVIVRSGCYLPHDSLFYQRYFQGLRARRRTQAEPEDALKPALEVWASVQSVPEPQLAVLSVGKRDVSHDLELPVVEKWFRPGVSAAPAPLTGSATVRALHDQHACLHFSGGTDLAVGDMLALGVSHPCTTFDKWQLLWLVDDDYNITGGIRTFF